MRRQSATTAPYGGLVPSLDLAVPVGTLSMEAKLVDALPREPGWQFEPKWDGFRCLAFKVGDQVVLQAKSGKPLTRYFPEIVEAARKAPFGRLVLDGELAIPVKNSISFDSLQLRLHPAESRIRKLAKHTPAIFILFDCLLTRRNRSLLDAPLWNAARNWNPFSPSSKVMSIFASRHTRAMLAKRRNG